MKKRKLYNIAFMGDKDHGCDIISTLESWGGSNYYTRTGSDPEYVYFINDLGSIDFIHNSEMLSKEMKNFYFLFWHDYNIECQLKVGESINYGGQDYNVDSILFDANNRCIVYKLKSFGIGVEYITNNELIPTEKYQMEEENNEYLCENNMKTKLAIQGHPTRGNEVIKLLEMMGGTNPFSNGMVIGNKATNCYYISENTATKYISWDYIGPEEINEYKIFTLEEFLVKYPFKVGDKVVYEDDNDIVVISEIMWDDTVGDIFYNVKRIDGDDCFLCPPELLKLYKETNMNENKLGTVKEPLKTKSNAVKLVDGKVKDDLNDNKNKFPSFEPMFKMNDELEYKIPDGYEITEVSKNKVFLKPIKPKYPTTYEDCCKVLGISYRAQLSYTYPDVERGNIYLTKEKHLLDAFMKLRICRNAYWKIAGEEMELGKPWEPDSNVPVFVICRNSGDLSCDNLILGETDILEFPTEEMRDAFYKNFKDLIEQCKELL